MQVLKKLLLAFPVTLLVLFLMTGMAYAEGARTGVVTGDSINVRSNPSTSAKVVDQLSDGTKVSVLDSEGDWYKISSGDSKGWIFKDFLKLKDQVIAAGTINADSVNVRSKPDMSSDVVAQFDGGKKVDVYEHSGSWYRIGLGGDRYGWVNKDFISVRSSTVSRGLVSDTAPAVKPAATVKSDADVKAAADDQSSQSDQSDLRQQIVSYAKKFLGVRYVYGASSPDEGFDCSGFTSYVFKHFGISIERTAENQSQNGTKIDRSDLRPGDLVFFDTNGGHNGVNHVGIYIGDGQFIQASSGSSAHRVVISDLTSGFYDGTYMKSRRYISD